MSKKRRGEIEQINVDTFRVRYRQRNQDGKRITVFEEYVTGTRADAERRLTALLAEFDQGKRAKKNSMLLADWLDYWNQPHVRNAQSRRGCGPRELELSEQMIRLYLKPKLGHIEVQKITAQMIRDKLEEARLELGQRRKGKPLGKATIRHAYSKLKLALDLAVTDDLIAINPAMKVTRPTLGKKQDKEMPSVKDGVRLIESFDETMWRIIAAIVFESGVRLGEVTGTRYCDVSPTFNAIAINGVIERVAGVYQYRGYPKSESGQRVLRVSAEIIKAIADHRKEQDEIRELIGMPATKDDDLIFVRPDTLGPLRGDTVSHKFSDRMAELEIPGTLHTLRHAHASYLLTEKKEDLKLVQKRLGHSDPATTLRIYGHLKREIY